MVPQTLGVIIGNRDFFPDHLVSEARADLLALAKEMGVELVLLDPEESKLGGVETYVDARKCADLFRQNRDRIDGILVCLPNFGDEKGVADTLKLADLDVPVLVQGYPDNLDKMAVATRRDAFCGKVSVCNNLYQCGIPYSLTESHVVAPTDPAFRDDLQNFLGVCRVVGGIRGARLGAVGARPGAFNTVRYSEKILEANGVSVTTIDLSDIIAGMDALDDGASEVQAKLAEIKDYVPTSGVPDEKLIQMAKLGVVLGAFIDENALDATAIQCWTSVQKNAGINVCTVMSMLSQSGAPSACEVDVTGALTMYAMQLASGSPSALVDWNNNFADDPNKCVLFHCGNWAKSFLPDISMGTAPILGSTIGEENTYGTVAGQTPAGPLTFGRLTTDDLSGEIMAYIGEGTLTNDPVDTFGSRAVVQVPDLQGLMRFVCYNGFEHHVVMSQSHTADILQEAFDNYLGWEVYRHGA